MKQLRIVLVALVAFGIVAACSDGDGSGSVANQELVAPAELAGAGGGSGGGSRHISMLDDCAPDALWAPTGGCTLANGLVSFAEFGAFLSSPLSSAVVGHPAWRNEPSYLKLDAGKGVRVTNDGGRVHTFTEVAQFGGGRVGLLNMGLTASPECILAPGAVDRTLVLPGGKLAVEGLSAGNHRFICCIHPWMRALIKVDP